ncbi:MAG: Glycerophosphoryl diester phosphodiesterase, partial [Actinomycetia bacterium]|nr:Glycerophosphoryl diester phosphodiesterase [Actinomycetes bacterium]
MRPRTGIAAFVTVIGVAGKTMLPPGSGSAGKLAIADGDYPYVFNNDSVDGSFGVTPQLYLNEITPFGLPQGVIPVPSNELNTSFSSKSEGALNLSSDGKYVTFIDYVAAPDTVDASNANTPGVIDPTNPVPGAYYRAVASLSANGKWTFTETNAYSGNNGRAA